MTQIFSKDLCNILFGVNEINNKKDAQLVVLNADSKNIFKSYFYLELLEKKSYEILQNKKDYKENKYESKIEADSLFYLRDLKICSAKINEDSDDNVVTTFNLNENISYFSNFYDNKLEKLKNECFFTKNSVDKKIFTQLIENLTLYEEFFK